MKHFAKITITSSLILAFLGFLIATYLTIIHFKNIIPPCTIAHGCETVLTSKFATIGPIPIALIGSIYYLALIFVLGLTLTFTKKQNLFKKILILSTFLALIASIILVGIQAFILHAFCQWCLTCEAINLVLFILILLQSRFE